MSYLIGLGMGRIRGRQNSLSSLFQDSCVGMLGMYRSWHSKYMVFGLLHSMAHDVPLLRSEGLQCRQSVPGQRTFRGSYVISSLTLLTNLASSGVGHRWLGGSRYWFSIRTELGMEDLKKQVGQLTTGDGSIPD